MIDKFSKGKPYKVIAYVLACFSNDEQMRIIKKVAKECKKYHCKVVFFSTVTDFFYNDSIDAGEKKIFELVEPKQYDAIVLMSESFKQDEEQMDLVRRANLANVPIFAVDKCFDGCINLVFDYTTTFRAIMKHMVEEHGYRNIIYMGGMPDNSFSEERLNIYKEVLAENNIPYDPRKSYYGYFWEDPTNVAMDRMFEDWKELPEAIVCANDAMALAVIKYLRKMGYSVPEDVAVSGFDAIELEKYSNPRLTTGIYNVEDMIHLIFQMITEGDWEEYRKKKTPIYNQLQIGRSCGCHGLEACNMVDELRQVKQELHLLMKYHSDVNQMVANYGNMEDLEEVVEGIANYTRLLRFKDVWLCFDETLINHLQISYIGKYSYSQIDMKEWMGMLHYEIIDGEGVYSGMGYMKRAELIPNSEEFFENNDYCMVTVLHMNGMRIGYTLLRMDVDEFNFMAYDPFLTNMRHLLELQESQRKILRIYENDQLTNLFDRNGFYKKVQALFTAGEDKQFTIINIDMDGLKKVNDTYGHSEGDEALKSLGRIIQNSVNDEIAARVGGDEFLIAFAGEDNEERAEHIKALIIQGLDAYNQNSTKPYVLQASMGAFTANMNDYSLDYFLKKADEMMYIVKSQHKREMGELS
ncbi:MAG: GGDEF domain-containing protein [Lachnospiraceae bacterium]|nr:GGDEF domain-containing protein [Lachnospiraceae bacterium]